jgi:hypothetical protein
MDAMKALRDKFPYLTILTDDGVDFMLTHPAGISQQVKLSSYVDTEAFLQDIAEWVFEIDSVMEEYT